MRVETLARQPAALPQRFDVLPGGDRVQRAAAEFAGEIAADGLVGWNVEPCGVLECGQIGGHARSTPVDFVRQLVDHVRCLPPQIGLGCQQAAQAS